MGIYTLEYPGVETGVSIDLGEGQNFTGRLAEILKEGQPLNIIDIVTEYEQRLALFLDRNFGDFQENTDTIGKPEDEELDEEKMSELLKAIKYKGTKS